MAKVKVTQIVSTSGSDKRQIANLRCLGIRKMHQSVVLDEKNAVAMGQLAKVAHLVKVESVKK